MLSKLKLLFFRRRFRRFNSHNLLQANNIFDLRNVECGNYSYGFLNIQAYGNCGEKLKIGNFVSIANEVVFILGGIHNLKAKMTYPLFSKFVNLNPEMDAKTKGQIVVEDDVWLGYGVIVLSGLRIGKGVIVAAGSVVTKDLEPYGIYGGNPCKLIRFRFDSSIIDDLLKLDYSRLSKDDIIKNIDFFYNITENNCHQKNE